MDEEINMQWVQDTFIPGIRNDIEEKVLFADNVGFQQSQQFHETCRNQINTTVYMLPENHTDKIQPIDAGCGRIDFQQRIEGSCSPNGLGSRGVS